MVRNLRWVYAGLFWVITAAIVVQFFLAGWAVFAFAGVKEFELHLYVGGVIGLGILLGVPLAFAARVPWQTTGFNAGLFALMILQSILAHVPVRGLAALHVVNGVLIFVLTAWLTRSLTMMARAQSATTPAGQSVTG